MSKKLTVKSTTVKYLASVVTATALISAGIFIYYIYKVDKDLENLAKSSQRTLQSVEEFAAINSKIRKVQFGSNKVDSLDLFLLQQELTDSSVKK